MSIASNFRAKMDVPLYSADQSVGMTGDTRRAMMAQALDRADLMLVEKDYITALFYKIKELQNEHS